MKEPQPPLVAGNRGDLDGASAGVAVGIESDDFTDRRFMTEQETGVATVPKCAVYIDAAVYRVQPIHSLMQQHRHVSAGLGLRRGNFGVGIETVAVGRRREGHHSSSVIALWSGVARRSASRAAMSFAAASSSLALML